jgi:hypothetical protein
MSGHRSLFDRIRDGAAHVSRNARFVQLMSERIPIYAAQLAADGLPMPMYDTTHHARGTDVETVAFLLTLDSINFGSGYFPHLRKRPGMSGYFTIATSLKERWQQEGAFTASDLRALRLDTVARLFGQQENDGPAHELMALFTRALKDLGVWLGRYDDDPLAPIQEADRSAAKLVTLLNAMPLFRDVASYDGREAPLYKRSQLMAADLALAFGGQGAGRFDDLDNLTIFADNLVPHVLRVDGVLAYDTGLLARIERGDLIPAGSAEEVEIRAVAVHAVERIVGALRAAGITTTARQLDYLLWHRGQGAAYKALPRHRTRTVAY